MAPFAASVSACVHTPLTSCGPDDAAAKLSARQSLCATTAPPVLLDTVTLPPSSGASSFMVSGLGLVWGWGMVILLVTVVLTYLLLLTILDYGATGFRLVFSLKGSA